MKTSGPLMHPAASGQFTQRDQTGKFTIDVTIIPSNTSAMAGIKPLGNRGQWMATSKAMIATQINDPTAK